MPKPDNQKLAWLRAIVANPPAECAECPGGLTNGYGTVTFNGRSVTAHRLAYELAYGPIPAGLVVRHGKDRRCVSRACCNPAHLCVGTHAENSQDMTRDGIVPGPLPSRGETSRPYTFRLTPDEFAKLDALPGATRGDKFRRLIQIGDIAVSDNCDAHQIATLAEALSQPPTKGSSDV